jgi:hypothetical protein
MNGTDNFCIPDWDESLVFTRDGGWHGLQIRDSADEDLPAGAYIISLVENGKEVESLRVVKSER